jgi:hypothetical protein
MPYRCPAEPDRTEEAEAAREVSLVARAARSRRTRAMVGTALVAGGLIGSMSAGLVRVVGRSMVLHAPTCQPGDATGFVGGSGAGIEGRSAASNVAPVLRTCRPR